MPSFNHHGKHKVFDRSFDTASQNTGESHDSRPSRSKRTVPFVNERREFDPRYDPRKPETYLLHHQPRRELYDDEARVSPDAELQTNINKQQVLQARHRAASLHSQHHHLYGDPTNRHAMHSNSIRSRVLQRRQAPTPASNESTEATVRAGSRNFFHCDDLARFDRPFDESSHNSLRGSTAEIDSLDEVLQQDSFTTTTETTGDDRFENILSAIEEHPSLEGGSLSYSFTQLTASMLPSMKSGADSSCDQEEIARLFSRSRSPLDSTLQSQNSSKIFRNQHEDSSKSDDRAKQTQESTRSIQISPGQEIHPQQSARPNQRINTWDTSARSSDHFGTSSRSTAPETPSNASSSLSPSEAAQREAEKILHNFKTSRRKKEAPSKSTNEKSNQFSPITTSASTTEEAETFTSEDHDLTLHDLCGESSSTDDIAWRNALHVLSVQPHLASVRDGAGWTPLHVACLGSTPPPLFIIRSLLYVYREAAREVDGGGRLPLHLVAASSGDIETMELLTQEYPQAVYQIDCQGWTPLHLILKNFGVGIQTMHCRVLLGLITPEETEVRSPRVLQRRGEHLKLPVEELERVVLKTTPVTRLAQEDMHEQAFREFPLDVQVSLRRLCQWKRKQRRQSPQADPDEAVKLDMADAETNPAAYFTPVKRQLPIHIVVRRGLSESRTQRRRDFGDEDGAEDWEAPTSTGLSPSFFELVRLFITFYPEGLVARDFNGYTPLLAALSMNNAQPSMELVELLLGKRTSGYNTLPSWAQNMPLYNLNADRYLNPAMIPCRNSHQLPLHVVAEEEADNFSMLSSVQGCYPGAIQCQDSRGRTPLHILLRNYRRSQIDPRTIALLLSDDVAQTLDDEGKLPFDLLAERAGSIPSEQPHSRDTKGASADEILTFKKFFQGTIIASAEPSARNRLECNKFLWRLRSLPPWLRRQACSASFVQELLIEELASPLKCALIMFYAALLCALIVVFRMQVHIFIDNPETTVPAWQVSIVYTATSVLFLFQLVFWSFCISMSEFLHLCILNLWRWIDLSALLLVCIATMHLNFQTVSNEVVLAFSTAATGLLWLSAVGFLASWWYGASLFVACVQKIARLLFWPIVVTSILTIAFVQMFYTTAHADCNEGFGDNSLCSLRESYILIYYLIIGEPIVDMESDTRISSTVTTLAMLFITALLILVLGIMAMVIFAGSNCDYDELALASYWEPKLTFVIFACGSTSFFSKTQASSALETAWVVATNVLSGRDGDKGTYWYAHFSRKPTIIKACYWLIAILLVPIWILAGLFTFGLLWPPQVRRFLFRHQLGDSFRYCTGRGNMAATEVYASQVSSLRNELTQIRDMSYERSNDVQRDLRELKEILHLATAEY